MNMKTQNKLTAKDLINVGVYTAIYFVVQFILGMTGFIPIMMIVMPPVLAFVGSIILMLYFSKVKRFGMVTISGILIALIVFLTGRPWQCVAICLLCGLAADLILKSGQYHKVFTLPIACGFMNLWQCAMALPMFFGFRKAFMASMVVSYGQEYVDTLSRLTPDWMFFVLTAIIFIFGILGGLFGRTLLKKHFVKAGMVK